MSTRNDLVVEVGKRVTHLNAIRSTQDGRTRLALLRRNPDPSRANANVLFAELAQLPSEFSGRSDALSASEEAAYLTLALYAAHQQSVSSPMHQPGTKDALTLGGAVALLRESSLSTQKRMVAVLRPGVASSEISRHLSSVISRLRSAGFALDYGLLAGDLYIILNGHPERVATRWHRAANYVLNKNTDLPEGN